MPRTAPATLAAPFAARFAPPLAALATAAPLWLPAPAGAQTLTGAQAAPLVYPAGGTEFVTMAHEFLTDADKAALQQVASAVRYYAAVAASPDEGLLTEATVAAANYHDPENARRAALAGCAAKQKAGTKPCVIVAELRPKGWTARPLQLSADAADAFATTYAQAPAPKALALSAATGSWAVSSGAGAADKAVAACAAKGGATDCAAVIAD